MRKSRILARKGRVKARAWSRENEPHAEERWVPGRGGEQMQRAFVWKVGESMGGRVNAKCLKEDLESLSFTLSLAKPKIGKEVG